MSIDRQKKQKTPDQRELIVAPASPPGQGGVGIVRLSGKGALQLAERLCNLKLQPRHAHLAAN